MRSEPSGFAAAFSPDGKTLALSTRRISFVDVETGTRHDGGHTSMITSARFTADGKYVLTTSTDGTFRQWNPATGKQVRPLKLPAGVSQVLAVSADDATVAGKHEEEGIVLWDRDSAEVKATFGKDEGQPVSAAFSPAGDLLATAGPDAIRVWDTSELKIRQSWKYEQTDHGPVDNIHLQFGEIAFVGDGPQLAAAFPAKYRIAVYNMQQDSPERILVGARSLFWSPFALSPDGSALAYAGGDRVALWNPKTGRDGVPMQGRFSSITSIAYSADGKLVAAGGQEMISQHESKNVIRVWSSATGRELLELNGHHEWIHCLAFSPSGEKLVSGSQDATLLVWGIQEARSTVAKESNEE